MSANLSIPQLETKITKLGKSIKRSGRWSKAGKLAVVGALVAAGVTIAGNVKNDEKVSQDTAVPAAVALAGYGIAVGAGKRCRKKTIDFNLANQQLNKAKTKQAEEERLAEIQKAEEIRKAQEAEEAKIAAEKAKSRLTELERLPRQEAFYFCDLDSFGVVDKIPFKKEGADYETGEPRPGINYAEYYKTKDGCTVEAGIKYANVPKGVEHKDYTYRYIKVLDPTVPDVVCEEGQLSFLDEKGYAVGMRIEKKLDRYEKDWRTGTEKRTYKNGQKYFAIHSNRKVAYFPEYEQQVRKQVMNDSINQLAGWEYTRPVYCSNVTFDAETGKCIYK